MEIDNIKENKTLKKNISKTSSGGSCGKKSKHKRSKVKKKHKKKSRRRSSSTSSSISASEHRKKIKKKKSKHKRSYSTSTSSSSAENEPKKVKTSNTKKEKKKAEVEENTADVPIDLMEKSKAMAPMTKEEWEKRQSVVRRVYDEASGRHRLVKGDGEIIEEIVSRDRHQVINKTATLGDGMYFQSQMSKSIK